MKTGYRKPNIKKSLSARTSGQVKRTAKRAASPLYGKEGMGWVNNPKKAVYNKVYNKTTKSVFDDDSSAGCIGCGCIGLVLIGLYIVISMITSYVFGS